MAEIRDINLGEVNTGEVKQLDPRDLLGFARWILTGLFTLFVAAVGAYLWRADPASKEVFDVAKTVLPPIATFIIGFYFRAG